MWFVHYLRSYPNDAEIELKFFETEAAADKYVKRLEQGLVDWWNAGLVEDHGKDDAPVMTVDDLNTDPFFDFFLGDSRMMLPAYNIHKGIVATRRKIKIN